MFRFSPHLIRPLAALLLTLWASICLALPAPHDIEQAVANGQLPQAERMLREVIAEKPRSARAHYELAQVLAREGRIQDARQSLERARGIDPSLQFAQSPEKFKALEQAIEQSAQAQTARTAVTPAAAAPQVAAQNTATQPAWLWPALLSGGFALLVLALWRRSQSNAPAQARTAMAQASAPMSASGWGNPAPNYPAPNYPASYPSPYPAPASGGSTVAGAVVGGLAGVAAGYALSKALEDHDRPHGNPADHVRPMDPSEEAGLVRMDNPAPDLGAFDAGSGGDSWDNTPSSDDDSW